MPIEFRCSRCDKLLRTGDDTAGRTAQCPECGAQTPVPTPEMSDSPFSGAAGSYESRGLDIIQAGNQNAYQPGAGQGPAPVNPGTLSYALNRLSAPSACLLTTAILGLVLGVLGLLENTMHFGFVAALRQQQAMHMLLTGPVAIAHSVIGIVMSVVVFIGAMKMKNLEGYWLAVTASILALIPCTSPCCCLGLPFGIWALIVLSDPAVKASFKN